MDWSSLRRAARSAGQNFSPDRLRCEFAGDGGELSIAASCHTTQRHAFRYLIRPLGHRSAGKRGRLVRRSRPHRLGRTSHHGASCVALIALRVRGRLDAHRCGRRETFRPHYRRSASAASRRRTHRDLSCRLGVGEVQWSLKEHHSASLAVSEPRVHHVVEHGSKRIVEPNEKELTEARALLCLSQQHVIARDGFLRDVELIVN